MKSATSQQPGEDREDYVYRDSAHFTKHVARRTGGSHAAFFLPHLRPGMSLLDCGCGPGSITIDLAEVVSPGQVIGVDVDVGQIELAQKLAAERGIPNVRFETGDIYELSFPDDSFDAVFAHGVLEHLRQPGQALTEVRRVLKPGGIVGVRSVDLDGLLLATPASLLAQTVDLMVRLHKHNGGNQYFGKHLRASLREAGFTGVEASASYESYGTPDATRWYGEGLAAFILGPNFDQVTELGWADSETLEKMSAAWKVWAENPDAFMAHAWCDAVGWKE